MEYQEIPLESLLLDTLNPRHEPVESQREALRVLLDDKGAPQLLRLAEDIAENGPSPIELALVVPDGNIFIVVEGNRRVAAMKLIKNPGLAEGTKIRNQIRDLSRRSVSLTHMACIVAESRQAARRWIELRHNAGQQGVGVVGWSPEMQVRFTQNFAGQRGRALRLTDALELAYEGDAELLELIQQVKAAKITTLGRLVSDPDFRNTAGIEIDQNDVYSHFPTQVARQFWYRIFSNLNGDLTVSKLKDKDQRLAYLATLSDVLPPDDQRRALRLLTADEEEDQGTTVATSGGSGTGSTSGTAGSAVATGGTAGAGAGTAQGGASAAATKRAARTQRARPMKLFDGLTLRNVKPKVRDVLREAQKIDLTTYPNAGAVLIRVIVELVVTEAADHYRWVNVSEHLRDRLNACLRELDPSGRANQYAAIRRGLSDRDSPFAVRSIHAYLHNPELHPEAASLRAVSDNYAPLLRDLDAVLA